MVEVLAEGHQRLGEPLVVEATDHPSHLGGDRGRRDGRGGDDGLLQTGGGDDRVADHLGPGGDGFGSVDGSLPRALATEDAWQHERSNDGQAASDQPPSYCEHDQPGSGRDGDISQL